MTVLRMSTPANLKMQALAESAASSRSLSWYLCWGALLALLAWSWQGADMRPMELWRDSGNMKTYAAEFFPPNFGEFVLASCDDFS